MSHIDDAIDDCLIAVNRVMYREAHIQAVERLMAVQAQQDDPFYFAKPCWQLDTSAWASLWGDQ